MITRVIVGGGVALMLLINLAISSPAYADDETDSLRAQMQALSDRLYILEKEKAAAALAAKKTASDQPKPVTIAYPSSMQLVTGDTTLSLYAIVDATFATQSNADALGHRGSAPVVSWMSGNRFGIDASHIIDSTSKFKVIGRVENEFELPTGNLDTPNVLFNRDAWIGVQGTKFGKLTIGRQNTLPRDFAQSWGEAFGSRQVGLDEGGWNNNAQMQYMINYAGGANGTRYNSAVVYKKMTGHFVYGVAHQFNGAGGYVPGDFNNGTTSAGAFGYNGGALNVSTTFSDADIAGYNHQVFGFGGNLQINPTVLFRAGYFHNSADQAVVGRRKDNVITTSVTLTPPHLPKTQFDLGYYNVDAANAGNAKDGTTLGVNSDTSAVLTAASGNFNTFYGAMFYRWDRQTDVYLAGDIVHTHGGFAYGFTHGHPHASELGTGLRFKI